MPPPPPPPSSRTNNSRNMASAASKEENIYIPSFISKRPFYAADDTDSNDYLEHQRKKEDDAASKGPQWYDRGRKAAPAATKYRKGACENCGAMTHKTRDCLSRPRAKGAKWTGKDIQADELIQDVKLGWDAKRDRWNGFDPREYRTVVDEYNQLAAIRRRAQNRSENPDDEADEEFDDGDKYAEESDMSKHQSNSTRQLRLREDTATYLLNLDLDSAKYDPKTRRLIDAGATADKAASAFAEQGFLRESGDASEFQRAQRYAWEAQETRGDSTLHVQANPTAGEIHRKKTNELAEQIRQERDKALLEKYGGEQHILPPERLAQLGVAESETFVEYDETGAVKGAPKSIAHSRYPEDVYPNNHSSVFGSWWNDFKWGYSCCNSFIKNSYCTGEEGKLAWEAADRQRKGINLIEDGTDAREGGDDVSESAEEVKSKGKVKKRTAVEMMGGVTEQEMDEYRRKRTAADDPMARMLGKDELVH